MMNENTLALIDAPTVPTAYELGTMSAQQLRGELARSLTMSAQHLAYLAVVWAELEKRGEDLSDLRVGLAVYLPQIAAGHLDAGAVIRFAGQPTVLRNLATLPIEQQREIVSGKPVEVLTVNAQGEYESAQMPAYTLTGSQARMVFDSGKLRSAAEQRAMLEAARVSAKRRARPGPEGRVRYDRKADVLRIGRSSATVGEVVAALMAESATEDAGEHEELTKAVLVKVTESEHRMIKARAAEAGQDMQVMLRQILRQRLVL